MNFEKITHSKCPHCKKHGISAFFKTSYKHNPVIRCKYCGKKFKVNRAFSIIMILLIVLVVGISARIINENWFHIPLWLVCIIVILLFLISYYFAQLEDINDK